jgi:hypothetical protein
MATSYERLYEIALGAIDEQRRQISDARSGIPAVGAAAAVIAALTKAAFDAPGTINTAFAVLGAVGIGAVLVCGVQTLRTPGRLALSFDAEALREATAGMLDNSDVFHSAVARLISDRRHRNERGVRWIKRWFAGALAGLIAEAIGLVVAAVVHF